METSGKPTAAPLPSEELGKHEQNFVGKKLRATVIVDWERCSRGVFWRDIVDRINEKWKWGSNPAEIDLTVHRFADQLARPADDPNRHHILQKCEVLIINWDAINGDPNFGAHIPLHWLEQQGRLEILDWIRSGGILIVEGQATLSVANQKSYDALLGPSEVSVCGMEDELDVRDQKTQVGHYCKMTQAARNCKLFPGLDRLDSSYVKRNHEEMFPECAPFITLQELEGIGWNILYRGWFRWIVPLHRRRLRWVPLIKTVNRGWNHPTMLVAKHGDGAIFVSTMFLASSQQVDLVKCLFLCHGKTNLLPSPSLTVSALLQEHITNVLWPILAAALAVLIAGKSPLLEGVATWILVIVGLILFGLLGFVLRWLGLRRFLRRYISWR